MPRIPRPIPDTAGERAEPVRGRGHPTEESLDAARPAAVTGTGADPDFPAADLAVNR
ncbi:hypothetical protein [Kitasatospora sp. NPDC008115]|uniref:hypothetical protein n=1 Tax=Kitasatospora sp. NPDC008115 TaxID=3364022 RepID=UPI0036ED6941